MNLLCTRKSWRIIGMGMFHGTLVRFLGIVRLVACHFISLVPLALELQSAESLSSRKTVAQQGMDFTFYCRKERECDGKVKTANATKKRNTCNICTTLYLPHINYHFRITRKEESEETERIPYSSSPQPPGHGWVVWYRAARVQVWVWNYDFQGFYRCFFLNRLYR